MKGHRLVIAVTIIIGFCSGEGSGADAVSRGTVPPSSLRSGLIPRPHPIDTSGNLMITGNVAGGRQFQGPIPYQSPTSFQRVGGALPGITSTYDPYTTLDPFRRRTAYDGAPDYLGRTTPYYPISSTVTHMPPGAREVLTPPVPEIQYRLGPAPQVHTLTGSKLPAQKQELPDLDAMPEPLVGAAEQTENVSFTDADRYLINKRLLMGLKQRRAEQLQQELKKAQPDSTQAQLRPTEQQRLMQLRSERTQSTAEDLLKPLEQPVPKEPAEQATQPDVYEQMKRQAEDIDTTVEKLTPEQKAKKTYKDEKQKTPDDSKLHERFETRFKSRFTAPLQAPTREGPASSTDPTQNLDQDLSKLLRKDYLEGVDVSAEARAILGEHKTFASYAQDKFNQYMREAEAYLKQGKHYLAADTYAIAAVYKPNDPLVFAGRGHALFAAGEYVSSALYLARAIEIFPEYARFRIDLDEMIGDTDKLESRIKDVEQWLEYSDAGELHFLLAYVYLQMGRLEKAQQSIAKAHEKLPDAPAVTTLMQAIKDITKS